MNLIIYVWKFCEGGLDIASSEFIKRYAKEPLELLKKDIDDSAEEYIDSARRCRDSDTLEYNSFSVGTRIEGLARLFNDYQVDFIGQIITPGKSGIDLKDPEIILKLQDVCTQLEEAIREKRFKEQSA